MAQRKQARMVHLEERLAEENSEHRTRMVELSEEYHDKVAQEKERHAAAVRSIRNEIDGY